MMRVATALFAVCLSLVLPWCAAAPVIGAAPYAGNVAQARAAAIDDALHNAALFDGAVVTATGYSEDGKSAQSQQVQAAALPGSYTLLREWREGGLYFVQIEPGPVLPSAPPATASTMTKPLAGQQSTASKSNQRKPLDRCAGGNYRRKALVTPFWLTQPVQANDLTEPSRGFERMLMDRLQQNGRFLPYAGQSELAFSPQPGWPDPQLEPAQVRALARRYGVQFVVGGVVHDLSASGEKYRVVYGSDVRPQERKLDFGMPLADWFGVGVKASPRARQVDMEVYLFDGVSGALVSRHRAQDIAHGQVMVAQGMSTDSAAFDQSDLGQAVVTVLDKLTGQLAGDVTCIPFSARVTRVDGSKLYLDAGAISGVSPGDLLQLYRLEAGQDVQSLSGYAEQGLGMPEALAGSVRVTQVQPLFSIAQVDGGRAEVGDYVRFVSVAR